METEKKLVKYIRILGYSVRERLAAFNPITEISYYPGERYVIHIIFLRHILHALLVWDISRCEIAL